MTICKEAIEAAEKVYEDCRCYASDCEEYNTCKDLDYCCLRHLRIIQQACEAYHERMIDEKNQAE